MDLISVKVIKDMMRSNKLGFNKSYGQNFLIDENVLKIILESVKCSCGCVLEIGTGLGTLTKGLAECSKKVISVEIDSGLYETSRRNFSSYENVSFINEDILKINLENISKEFSGERFQVAANLPYYISTPIIMKLIEGCDDIDQITVMVQKEVADRITADEKDKNYGVLSVIMSYYAQAEVLTYVPPESFIPQPKVYSAVVKIIPKPESQRDFEDEKKLFSVVKSGFSNRRKTFVNSASSVLNVEKSRLISILQNIGIDPMIRAECLSLQDFKNISLML